MRYLTFIFFLLSISANASAKIKYDIDSLLGPDNIILKTYYWVDKTFNSFDTTYVSGSGKLFYVKLKNDNWNDAYDFHIKDGASIEMASDIGCFIGGEVGYRAISISYMVDVQNAFKPDAPIRKKFNFSFTCSNVSFNAFYYKNNGSTNITSYGERNNMSHTKHKFSGIKTESYGANAYYIFNDQRYSHAAAYDFSRIQKLNAGSFFLGASISSHNIEFDFSALPPDMQKIFTKQQLYYNFKYNDYSVIFGYGYNWVFAPKWLLGVSALPSLGVKHSFQGHTDGNRNQLSINSAAKLAIVYNHSRYFAGVVGQYNAYLYLGEPYRLINLIGNLNLSVGVRF